MHCAKYIRPNAVSIFHLLYQENNPRIVCFTFDTLLRSFLKNKQISTKLGKVKITKKNIKKVTNQKDFQSLLCHND